MDMDLQTRHLRREQVSGERLSALPAVPGTAGALQLREDDASVAGDCVRVAERGGVWLEALRLCVVRECVAGLPGVRVSHLVDDRAHLVAVADHAMGHHQDLREGDLEPLRHGAGSRVRKVVAAMSTGDPSLDAWLYIAIVPIIMNAFMFFMFSRISRLKLPCFAPKYSEKLEKGRERHEASLLQQQHGASEAILLSSPNSSSSVSRFDKREAFKVGIVFMLLINMTLLIIAASFLGYQGALESIWILFVSMIVVPVVCSVIAIYTFAYFVDRGIHLCRCCVNTSNAKRSMRNSNTNGYSNNNNHHQMSSTSASINKLSISLKKTDSASSSDRD
eukprot:CAMPEP_0197049460 /NCGR_PEP_ID=MMETSP1384-20130603/24591_1 /TAXON_ID=29189 /ORGANISM="Ammonia sp." /LENGTH=333 /DNA_ID=CAMNT_0042481737 /DNA_START=470 /DNA_END=1472 /DNA_ORIENTATION=+